MPEPNAPRSRVGVVARFAVKPGQVEEFVERARVTMIEPTLEEPGCIRYELWQDRGEPGRFAMIEEWESEEALATHLAQESLQQAVAALVPMAAEPIAMQRLVRRG
jgi:quinol monooxygenase YgiN